MRPCRPVDLLSPSTDCEWCRQMTVVAVKWSPDITVSSRLPAAREAAGCVLLLHCDRQCQCQCCENAAVRRSGAELKLVLSRS